MPDNIDLNALRKELDDIDEQLQTLLTRRAEISQAVARAKQAETPNPVFYRPEREADILRRVIERNQGPLPNESMVRFFREVLSSSVALQNPLTVAYLGPPGTYSQAAVIKQFGHAVEERPMQTIEAVFREVATKDADYGIVPVENSTAGGVDQTLELFLKSPLKVCGEVELAIHHCLMSRAEDLKHIHTIFAHQQALAQCRIWLDSNAPGIERVAVSSNAEATRIASENPEVAAIAGRTAASMYELTVLAGSIEDEPNNTTRFAVLGRHNVSASGNDKTSLVLSMPNKPGALHQLLAPFAENGLSMTRIESKPSRQGMWDYVFFVDVEGHIENQAMQDAIKQIEQHCGMLKHLGSYPKAIL